MPDLEKINAVLTYLRNAFPGYEINNPPYDINFRFTVYKDGVSHQVIVWGTLIHDQDMTTEKFKSILYRGNLAEVMRRAGGRPVVVTSSGTVAIPD